jgi:perosamine synthetase
VIEHIPLSAPEVTEAEIAAVTAVLRTPRLSLGPELAGFETELASYHGVEHAVAVSSGTAGLHLALLVLGVGNGDEVILPSFAFVGVANAVHQVGATPVFAEIDPLTLNLDPTCAEQAITSRTRAILAIHTFGVPAEMEALRNLAQRYCLALIEDACEAIGARFDGHRTGSFGDLAILAFYPNKQMTTGEGGAVLARDPEHAVRLHRLRNQGRDPAVGWLDQIEPGYNYRLSELACALGRTQLRRLDEVLARRRQVAEIYDALLYGIPGLELPPLSFARREISWFVYVVRLPERLECASVQDALAREGIASGRYFAPLHLQPAWRGRNRGTEHLLSLTESLAKRTLALPFFNNITEGQQRHVAEILRAVMARAV